jgi:hypothetical protein
MRDVITVRFQGPPRTGSRFEEFLRTRDVPVSGREVTALRELSAGRVEPEIEKFVEITLKIERPATLDDVQARGNLQDIVDQFKRIAPVPVRVEIVANDP